MKKDRLIRTEEYDTAEALTANDREATNEEAHVIPEMEVIVQLKPSVLAEKLSDCVAAIKGVRIVKSE